VAQSGRHWKRGQERLRKCADNETGGCRRSNTGVGQTCDGRYVFGPVVDFEFTKKFCDQNETTVYSKVQLARKMYALYILINDAGNIFWSTRSALILLLFFPGFFVPALIGKTKQMRCGDERYSPATEDFEF
jgi:hypothetical protein